MPKSGKLVQQGSHSSFIGHGGSQTTMHRFGTQAKKWRRSILFRFNEAHYFIPSHSLPLSFRSAMGQVKIEGVSELHLSDTTATCDSATVLTVSTPLSH